MNGEREASLACERRRVDARSPYTAAPLSRRRGVVGKHIISPLIEFYNDSANLLRRCHKPDRKGGWEHGAAPAERARERFARQPESLPCGRAATWSR